MTNDRGPVEAVKCVVEVPNGIAHFFTVYKDLDPDRHSTVVDPRPCIE